MRLDGVAWGWSNGDVSSGLKRRECKDGGIEEGGGAEGGGEADMASPTECGLVSAIVDVRSHASDCLRGSPPFSFRLSSLSTAGSVPIPMWASCLAAGKMRPRAVAAVSWLPSIFPRDPSRRASIAISGPSAVQSHNLDTVFAGSVPDPNVASFPAAGKRHLLTVFDSPEGSVVMCINGVLTSVGAAPASVPARVTGSGCAGTPRAAPGKVHDGT